jgi:hypothetical protein
MAAMKSKLVNIFMAAVIIGLSIWLYDYDKAAEPGGLSSVHADIADCTTCHIPWQGVTYEMCLECHYFDEANELHPRIRFHTDETHCLSCHSEHFGYSGNIAKMNHTVLNEALSCTMCHYDPHEKLFGSNCRTCHGISTWKIKGYKHPSSQGRNCNRCHRAPQSHQDENFWKEIEASQPHLVDKKNVLSPNDCWKCHTTHAWPHLTMKHKF